MFKILPPIRSGFTRRLAGQRVLSIQIKSVLNILSVRQKLQVFQPVVVSLKIFMVYLQTTFNRAVKSLPHYTVHTFARVYSVSTQCNAWILMTVKRHFTRPHKLIPRPSFPVFYSRSRCVASAHEGRHFAQLGSLRQHLLSLPYLFRRKQLAARYSTNATKIANLVNAFVFENRFPLFHSPLRLTYTQFNCTYVKGQAR